MANKELQVFYDGGCILCSKEIAYYKKKDLGKKIDFIDITDNTFNCENYSLDREKIFEKFHVLDSKGEIKTGVEAFCSIWETLNLFKFMQFIKTTWLGETVLKLGYNTFLKVRPYLPRKNKCNSESCKI